MCVAAVVRLCLGCCCVVKLLHFLYVVVFLCWVKLGRFVFVLLLCVVLGLVVVFLLCLLCCRCLNLLT